MKPSIYFRVDGDDGKKIGLGHVTRCSKIYKILKKDLKNKYNFQFIMKNYKTGIKYIKLNASKNIISLNSFFKINTTSKDIFIIDTIGIEKKLKQQLQKKKYKQIFTFEDTRLDQLKKTSIINGIYFSKKKLFKKKNIKIYQGTKYLILDKSFSRQKSKKKIGTKISILISSGGGDKKNFMYKVSKVLADLSNIKIFVIIGSGVKKKNPIYKFKKNKNFKFCFNNKNIFKLMLRSNIAIVSGGTVMFESICMGLITLVCKTYNNQKYAIKYFEKKLLIKNLGNVKKINKEIILSTINQLRENSDNQEKGKFIRKIKEIDGKGLLRVVKIIKKSF